jgi:hypothetical protein
MTMPTCLTLDAVVFAALPVWADKRLDEAVAKAETQLAKGKTDDAVKILQQAAGKAPRDPEPQRALARLQARLGVAWFYLFSGDDYKARFYVGLAAKEGADVGGVRGALSGQGAAGDELAELDEELESKDAGDEVRAVRRLVARGRPGVATLAAALPRKTTSLAAREAIAEGLGGLGPEARAALPQVERIVAAGTQAPADSREARVIEALRSAADKIRGK